MDSNGVDEQEMKLVQGAAGYVLEDVPHLTDYILDLPVLLSFLLSLRFIFFLDRRWCLYDLSAFLHRLTRVRIWCFLKVQYFGFVDEIIHSYSDIRLVRVCVHTRGVMFGQIYLIQLPRFIMLNEISLSKANDTM